jgi:uncharacterized RDD family membrane protein YckC
MNGAREQNLGKTATGLEIIHSDGSSISNATAFVRYFMQVLLGNLSLGVMYVFLAAHPEKKAGTI